MKINCYKQTAGNKRIKKNKEKENNIYINHMTKTKQLLFFCRLKPAHLCARVQSNHEMTLSL